MRANTARTADRQSSALRASRRVPAAPKRIACLAVAVVVLGSLGFPTSTTAGAAARSPLGVVGFLPDVPGAPQGAGLYGTFFMDAPGRRLYTVYNDATNGGTHLVEFDLDVTPVPKLIRDVALGKQLIGWQRPNQIAVDGKRKQVYVLSSTDAGATMTLIDLKTLKIDSEWNLAEKGAPGIVPLGITYSKKDERLYIVGHATGHKVTEATTRSRPYTPVVVLALERSSGQVAWRSVVSKCSYSMYTSGQGSLIVRSDNLDALYFACVKTDESPGQSGIVRVWIDPKATQAQADAFRTDFFPVSGQYSNGTGVTGFAAFDYKAERFYMLSQSEQTPGAWVFDGSLSSWVGFIAATDATNTGLGIDQGNGHVYIKSGSDGKLILADGRATPVPQGLRLGFEPMDGFYLVDPKTHRAFVWTAFDDPSYGARGEIAVIKDSTPRAKSLRPPNFDALTQDVPEGDDTVTAFSGGVNGYATRLLLVGGLPVTPGDTRPGDRGITAARVSSLDLREVAAQASAHAVVTDTNTEADLQEQGDLAWPWSAANCLDGMGAKAGDTKEEQGGIARVECDLANQKVSAVTTHSLLSNDNVSIGSSLFRSAVGRSEEEGIETTTESITTGISIGSPQGRISIGEVSVRARTVAHGRPGTTKATWVRDIRGVTIVDSAGKEVVSEGRCSTTMKEDSCGPLIRQINDALPRVRIDLYKPEIVKTPKGAYAGIQQSDADYYQGRTVYNQGTAFALENASRATPALQIVVFNDSAEKSRAILQLGAVQAGSIYTISKPPVYVPPDVPDPNVPDPDVPSVDPGAEQDAPSLETAPVAPAPASAGEVPLPDAGSVPLAAEDPAPATAPQIAMPDSPAEAVETVLAFFSRSPKEALLFGVFWLMLAAAGWTTLRRRSLVSMLSQEVS